MAPLPRKRFARRLRGLSGDELAAFVADLWAARGRETELEGRTVVATDPRTGTTERVAVGEVPADGDADAVVTTRRDGPGDVPDGVDRRIDADDLYEVALYAVDRADAERLLRTHLDLPVTVAEPAESSGPSLSLPTLPSFPMPATSHPALAAVVVLALVAVLLAGGMPTALDTAGLGVGSDAGGGDAGVSDAAGAGAQVTFVTPSVTATPARTPGRTPTPTSTSTSTPSTGGTTLPASLPMGSPWTTAGRTATRAGYAPNVEAVRAVERVTRQHLDAAVLASPLVGGRLYVATASGTVYGFAPSPVEVAWRSELGNTVTATPTLDNGTLYVGTVIEGASPAERNATPTLFALRTADGEPRWAVAPGGSVHAAPAVVDGTVYVTTMTGRLIALDAAEGVARWNATVTRLLPTAPAVADGTVYVGTTGGRVLALAAATGQRRWSADVGSPVGGHPVVANGTVYVGTTGGRVLAFAAATGQRRWSADVGASVRAAPAVADGNVLVADYGGNLSAFSAATGERRFRRSLAGRVVAAPTVVDGTVYVGTVVDAAYGGAPSAVVAVALPDGRVRWRVTVGAPVVASPTPTDGALYVPTADGRVVLVTGTAEESGGPSDGSSGAAK